VALFDATDDYSLLAPENLLIGSFEVLTNQPVDLFTTDYNWFLPGSFSDALTYAEGLPTYAAEDFSAGATDLASGDYGGGLLDYASGLNALLIDPIQALLIGAAESL
jgi:hypothetical protein